MLQLKYEIYDMNQKHIYNNFLMKPIVDQRVIEKSKVYSKEAAVIIQKTLSYSGMSVPSDLDYRAVRIYDTDYLHEIFSVRSDKKLPHLVLLHGFGGTSMTFVRLFKNLSQYYQVHALDTFGVGHSSHGQFRDDFTYEEARDYFVDPLEAWRTRLGIEEFTLVGHSFGGYIAVCYLEKHKKRVSRLVLLSPAGTTEKTPEQIQQELKARADKGIQGKIFTYLGEFLYNRRMRPSKIIGNYFFGEKFLDRIVSVRLKLKDEQNQAWKEYYRELCKKQVNSEAGFYIIFEWPLKPKHTIESILQRVNFQKPIQFYFGDIDWMDSKGAKRIADKYQNASFTTISNAGHQILFDNPEQASLYIIKNGLKETKQNQVFTQE